MVRCRRRKNPGRGSVGYSRLSVEGGPYSVTAPDFGANTDFGGPDEITPPEVQYLMAQQIPNASLQTFECVGHNMKVEIPDLPAGEVRDFIGKIDSVQQRNAGQM